MKSARVKLGSVLSASAGSLLYPQVVLLFFLPFLVSIILVILGFWLTWGFWLSYFESGPLALQPYWIWLLENSPQWLEPVLKVLSSIAPGLLFLVLLILSYPFVIALNLLFVSILVSTYLVKFLAARNYKNLQALGRPRFVEGLWNTISSAGLFLLYWFLSLPLWLIPGAQIAIPFLLTAWLNRRICQFDSLTDFASDDEMKTIRQQNSDLGFIMGLLTAALNFLPFAFFMSPVMTMVGFTHLNLQTLQKLRGDAANAAHIGISESSL